MDNGLFVAALFLSAALSCIDAVPVKKDQVLEADIQHAVEETGLVYSAANYLLGRWFTSATSTPTAPIVDEPTTNTGSTSTGTTSFAVPYVRTTPASLPPKQARGTELTESENYPLMNLFMILIRAVLDNAAAPSKNAEQQSKPCNCPSTQPPLGQPQANSLQSSLTQSAMKAVLMIVSDMLTTQMSPTATKVPTRTTGFFW